MCVRVRASERVGACFRSRGASSPMALGASYGRAPVGVVAVAVAGRGGGLVRDGGHCLDGAAEEAPVGGALPEGPPSPVVLHRPEVEAGRGLGGQAAAERLDLLGDEGGGGDVCVAEVADLLQGLARRGQGVHVQGRQVDGGGGELLVGAVVLSAQAVHPAVEVLQVDLFVILQGGRGAGRGGARGEGGCYRKKKGVREEWREGREGGCRERGKQRGREKKKVCEEGAGTCG